MDPRGTIGRLVPEVYNVHLLQLIQIWAADMSVKVAWMDM
jgi:hypothetical protein